MNPGEIGYSIRVGKCGLCGNQDLVTYSNSIKADLCPGCIGLLVKLPYDQLRAVFNRKYQEQEQEGASRK